MISKNILLKDILSYTISKIFPGLAGLLSVVLFFKIAGADNYGKYSLYLAQCNLIAAVAFGWLNQANLRYYTLDFDSPEYLLSQKKSLIYSCLVSFIFLLILASIQKLSMNIWLISYVTIFSIGGFNYLKTQYQIKLVPKKIIQITFFNSVLSLLIPIGLLFFEKNERMILIGIGISNLIVILFSKRAVIFNQPFAHLIIKTKNGNKLLKKWFKYGSSLSIWFALGLALPFFDRLFINKYLSTIELGVYAGSQELLTKIFSLIIFPLTLALHPRIINYWNDLKVIEAIKLIKWGFKIISLIGLTLFIFFWHFEEFFFQIIIKLIPEFKVEYKPIIFPLLVSGLTWQLSFISHKILELKEKTKTMVLLLSFSLVINIIGNIYFIPLFGIISTAYISLICSLFYCLSTTLYSINTIIKLKV
jgi:O-antigen/teichoic acid export membrane protein